MKESRRSSACSATRRGCGCCACSPSTASTSRELTGILGLAQSGVSRHLGLLKDAGLVAEERDGVYVYYRLRRRARPTATAPLWPLLDAQFAGAGQPTDGRGPTTRGCRKCCGCGRRTSTRTPARHARWPAARAGPQLGGVGARARPPAAAARRRRHRLRRRLPDARGGALGAPRRRRRSLRRRCSARAKALAERRKRRRTSRGRRATSTRLPLRDASVDVALLSQALHHAGRPGRASARSARASCGPAAACCPRPARARPDAGCATSSAISWLGFADDATRARCSRGAGFDDVAVHVGAPRRRRSVHRADRQRREAGQRPADPLTAATGPRTPPRTGRR